MHSFALGHNRHVIGEATEALAKLKGRPPEGKGGVGSECEQRAALTNPDAPPVPPAAQGERRGGDIARGAAGAHLRAIEEAISWRFCPAGAPVRIAMHTEISR